MKNKKRYRSNNHGKMIAMLIFSFILMLSVGYTALNEELNISGEANFRVEKDVRVTDVRIYTTTNSAIEDYSPNYGTDNIKVGVTLPNNQASVTYKVKVTNYSNCTINVTSIEKTVANDNYNVTYNKTLPLKMSKLSEEEIEITFSNATNESQTIESTIKFTFEKNEAIMTTGNGLSTSTFYRGAIKKDTVESIDFVSSKDVPNDAIGYWDVSYTAGTNEVIAYYLDEDEDNLYELYIGADGEVYAPSDSSTLFHSFKNVESINFNNSFNTEKATAMGGNSNGYGMFNNCSSLTNLDLSSFNTLKVTTMRLMFYHCDKLTNVNLSSFDVPLLNTVNGMFQYCSSLESITFGSKTTGQNITNMGAMFFNCSKLQQLDLSTFNTPNLINIGGSSQGMFCGCSSLTYLNISNLNTQNVSDMSYVFSGCNKLETLVLGDNFKTEGVTNMYRMFHNCRSFTALDLSCFNTLNVENMSQMFFNCSKLQQLNLSSFETTSLTDMNSMFNGCNKLTTVDIRNMDFEGKTINTTNMFNYATQVINIYVKNEYNQTYIQGLKSNANVIIYVPPEPEPEES